MTPARILERLDQAARRGKLAGFEPAGPDGTLFRISDFGSPFESVLEVRATSASTETCLAFTSRLKPLGPAIFVAALAVTVWPGVWLTDSLLRTYFTSYDFATWKWYLPLTAPFCPWAWWVAVKRSRASAAEAAQGLFDRIAALIDARRTDAGITRSDA